MDEDFVRKRITELRIQKGVSEYKMSIDMGHSKSYIQGITSGRALPSLSEFIYMCEYLGVSPKDFFDEEISQPILVQEVLTGAKKMKQEDLCIIMTLINRLNEKN